MTLEISKEAAQVTLWLTKTELWEDLEGLCVCYHKKVKNLYFTTTFEYIMRI